RVHAMIRNTVSRVPSSLGRFAFVVACLSSVAFSALAPGTTHAEVNNWTATGPEAGQPAAIAFDPSNPAVIYAGVFGGVFRTTNGGAKWSRSSSGIPFVLITCLAIDHAHPATIYAGSDRFGVFKSTDSGSTWTPMNSGFSQYYLYDIKIDPSNTSTIY